MRGKFGLILLVVVVVVAGLAMGGLAYWRQGEDYVTTQDAAVSADSLPVVAPGAGSLTRVLVKVGTRVHRGELLAVLTVSTPVGGVSPSGASTLGAAPQAASTATTTYAPGLGSSVSTGSATQLPASVSTSGSAPSTPVTGSRATNSTPAAPPPGNVSGSLPAVVLSPSLPQTPTSAGPVMSPSGPRPVNIVAPADGTLAAVNVVAGQTVAAGTPLFTLVRLEALRVVANIPETDINRVATGQRATITVDAEPGVDFGGRVLALQPATQSFFSFIPTAASAGTFTKVIQRIPVTLSVATRGHRLLPGESCEVRIRVR